MADVEHVDIQDPQIHEPKDISGSSAGEVYVADGGTPKSGAWQKQVATALDSETATDGQVLLADGTGGASWHNTGGIVYGQMDVVNNGIGINTVAAVDTTLNTDTDYARVNSAIWTAPTSITNSGVSFSTDKLIASLAGVYMLEFWASFTTPNNSKTAFKFAINTNLSTTKMSRTSGASAAYGVAAAQSLVTLAALDEISLYFASDITSTGGLLIEDAVLIVQLVNEI